MVKCKKPIYQSQAPTDAMNPLISTNSGTLPKTNPLFNYPAGLFFTHRSIGPVCKKGIFFRADDGMMSGKIIIF
jgi:hypothetical protein